MQENQDLQQGQVNIHKTFCYRLQPTKKQEQQLKQFAGCCRFVYNWGLARWQERYAANESTSVFAISNELVLLKKETEYAWLNECSAQALQQSLANLGSAFKAFFEKRSSYPVFKKKGKREAFRFMQYFKVLDRHLQLPLLGFVKYRKNRPVEGTVKHVTISLSGEHWYASVTCEVRVEKKYNNPRTIVGVDVGVKNFATTFDGNESKHHHHLLSLQQETDKLKKLQRQFCHKQKGSNNRNKARLKLSKQHQRIKHIRHDTIHKLTTALCKNHAAVAVEDLCIKHMTKSARGTKEYPGKRVAQKRGLNRSIAQQGWGILFRQLLYKCNWYGSLFVLVSAKNTSQMCPCCDFIAKENRPTQSGFKCIDCEYTQHADIVGAMNIRRRGMSCFG